MFSARENLRRCGARTSSRRPETCVELVRRGTSETLLLLLALELLARVGSVERLGAVAQVVRAPSRGSRAPSGARRLLRRYSYRFTARLEKGRQHFCGLSDMSPRHRGFSRTFPGFPPRTENPRGRHLGARRSQLRSERSCGRKPSYKAAALSLRSAPSGCNRGLLTPWACKQQQKTRLHASQEHEHQTTTRLVHALCGFRSAEADEAQVDGPQEHGDAGEDDGVRCVHIAEVERLHD